MDNSYYVYCFLDPNKPGKFTYGNICLLYEPFYIGKGCKERVNAHFYPSNLKIKNYKNNKIVKLLKNGNHPLSEILISNLNESDSYSLENNLVNLIGRRNIKTGPLCNLTDGGKGALNLQLFKKRKKVYQFDKEYNLLNEYQSITEASKENGLFTSDISKCCLNKSNTHGGFFWSFKKEDNKFITHKKSRKIHQYNLNGNLINEFNSITEASNKLNINNSLISRCCSQNNDVLQLNGFYFRYENDSFPYKDKKLTYREVVKIESDKTTLFKSVNESSKLLKISTTKIIRRCSNKYLYDDIYLAYKDEYIKGIRKIFKIKGNGEKTIYKNDINGKIIKEFSSITDLCKDENISRRQFYTKVNKNNSIYKYKNKLKNG